MGIYLITHEWFDIQQVLVVHVVLRRGIYLFTHEWFEIQQVLVVHVVKYYNYILTHVINQQYCLYLYII